MPEPGKRTLVAFDFGTKSIGIAVGNELTCTASPLKTVSNKINRPDWASITSLINQWNPNAFVVGLPLKMDDSQQPMTDAAKLFAKQLKKRYHLPVFFVDERLTSVAAGNLVDDAKNWSKSKKKGKALIDKLSAQLILETHFSDLLKERKIK